MNNVITCKECKYYTAKDGNCSRWNTGYQYDKNNMPSNEVLIEDDEGWGMICGPDFGCILAEKSTLP